MYANSTVYQSLSPRNQIAPLYRPRPTGASAIRPYTYYPSYSSPPLTSRLPNPASNPSWWEGFVGDSRPQNYRPQTNWTA